ncbi:peptidylprolyl isomerase [Dactylosporangium sp. NPDC000555]|uniref:peptidylprolyl isomerase n=1 Tax=Dactylosporangium sp. NPDC000555 TaxID=3154260 RepID=UPI00332CC337
MSTPPEPGDPQPPAAPEPGAPGAERPESPRTAAPHSAHENPQFAPPAGPAPAPDPVPASPPTGLPRWLVPVAGGTALALAVCAVVAYLAFVSGRGPVESIGGSVTSASSGAVGRGPAPQVGEPPTAGPATSSAASAAGPTGAHSPAAGGVPCDYASAARGGGDTRLIATPAPQATLTGRLSATIETNLGAIGIQLYSDRAPCTVNSFVHLSRDDFYSDTPCHRLTTEGLYVLQCGDPSGTGTGTPGYQFGEENLPTTLPPYPRGTLAMANAGPGTNGSQFFVAYKDSDIPPDYSVFGTVTSGLDLLDRIAAAGTTTGRPDGPPKLAVQISEIRVA